MSAEQYKGLWRASATEAVPYTDDFPEALLITPELWDGAISHGGATHILTQYTLLPSGKILLTVRDNGLGIKNERRLLTWAAASSSNNIHRNGHGTKKALTKYNGDYDTATWSIKYRRPGGNLQIIKSPFLGYGDTDAQEYLSDELTPSGTEFQIEFDPIVLGKYKTSQELTHALRELITTRYCEATLERVEFTLEINMSPKSITTNSRKNSWHSFQWHVDACPEVKKFMHHEEVYEGGKWTLDAYELTVNGAKPYDLKKPGMFPMYGRKNMHTSRCHTSLDGRMIEAIPIYKIMGSETPHNDYNGKIWFVNFTADDYTKLPIPATTKVSFYENGDVFKQFMVSLRGVITNEERRLAELVSQEERRIKEEQAKTKKEEREAKKKKLEEEKQERQKRLEALKRLTDDKKKLQQKEPLPPSESDSESESDSKSESESESSPTSVEQPQTQTQAQAQQNQQQKDPSQEFYTELCEFHELLTSYEYNFSSYTAKHSLALKNLKSILFQ